METRANYLLIGIFTLAGFFGLLGFLFWFAKFELDRQFDYYDVYFSEVSGLSRASEVRFAGLPVGQVMDMGLARDGSGRVRVRLEVREGTPIRTNSTAALESQGVTGVALVGITAGSPSAALLTDSGEAVPVIPSTRSALQTLTDQGPEMIERLNVVAEQLTALFGPENQGRVTTILENVERSTGNLDQAIADVSKATASIAETAESISGFGTKLDEISAAATTTMGHADDALQKFTETAGRVDSTLGHVDTALQSASQTMDGIGTYVEGDLTALTARLNETAGSVSVLAERATNSMDGLDAALASAGRAFDGADQVINTDIAPVMADLRGTLGNLNDAIASVSGDLPEITGQFRNAAQSADRAFASLRTMLDESRAPVQQFTREGLGQLTAVARDARGLVDNLNQLVSALRRNPSQVITGPRQPEFRR